MSNYRKEVIELARECHAVAREASRSSEKSDDASANDERIALVYGPMLFKHMLDSGMNIGNLRSGAFK